MDWRQLAHHSASLVCCIVVVLSSVGRLAAQTPVAHWEFHEGSGNRAVDSSGNGYTATLVKGIGWLTSPDAIFADASSRQFVITPPIDLADTNAITVALWVNRTYSTRGGAVLFEAPQDYRRSATGFDLSVDNQACQGIQASVRGNAGDTSICYSQPSSGAWHHLAVVFDKSQPPRDEIALYIDGVLKAPKSIFRASANTNNFGNNAFYLFSRGGMSNFASGLVADVRIYKTALAAQDIENLYGSRTIGLGPSFDLSAFPFALTVRKGGLGAFTITSTITNGFKGDVKLSATGVPPNSTVNFSPNPIPAPGSGTSTMSIGVGPLTNVGTYRMTVMGQNGNMQRISMVSVTVTNAPAVDLAWEPSLSQVIGYNAYRSLSPGGPYAKLNSDLISGTAYTDLDVKSGQTYYYVTTAVDSEQRESGYSNQAAVTIP
jgi:hypothetical protein